MLERPERAEKCRGVHERVETAQLSLKRSRDIAERVLTCGQEIERQDRRLRMTCTDNFVVQCFELSNNATMQYDGGAARRACECERTPEATGRAGNQHDAVGEIDV